MHPRSHTAAVLLENFSIFYEDDDTELNRSAVKDFKQNWFYFDKKATGKISSLTVKLFLRMLRIKVFYTYKINENGVKVSKSVHTYTFDSNHLSSSRPCTFLWSYVDL